MTDQPKPTPQWSILCDEARGRPRCLIVDKDGNEVAAVNPYRHDWNQVSELIARAPELQQRVDELQHHNHTAAMMIQRKDATIDELTADLRTASDQCEALSKDLSDHKQLIAIKNRQLDTMVEENRRLRELLRRVAIAAERDEFGSVGVELLEQIKHAIGRTGE